VFWTLGAIRTVGAVRAIRPASVVFAPVGAIRPLAMGSPMIGAIGPFVLGLCLFRSRRLRLRLRQHRLHVDHRDPAGGQQRRDDS
jgi:hypothetical protein